MNRYLMFTICALAAIVAANGFNLDESTNDEVKTQALLRTTNDQETKYVIDQGMAIYADFCIQSRDQIINHVRSKASEASSSGFNWFFSKTEDLAREAMAATKDTTARLGSQLQNPSQPVDGDDSVAAAQREIAEQDQPRAFFTAFRATLEATTKIVFELASEKFAEARKLASLNNLRDFVTNACEEIESQESSLRTLFEEYKKDMNDDTKKAFNEVPCVTTSRLVKANCMCRLAQTGLGPFKKVLVSMGLMNPSEDAE